jgi:hypothetical protein
MAFGLLTELVTTPIRLLGAGQGFRPTPHRRWRSPGSESHRHGCKAGCQIQRPWFLALILASEG